MLISLYTNRKGILLNDKQIRLFIVTISLLTISLLTSIYYLQIQNMHKELIILLLITIITTLLNTLFLYYSLIKIENNLSKLTDKLAILAQWTIEPDILNKDLSKYLKERELYITMIFGDIRGFSNFSKNHTAQEIKDMLNGFYKIVEKIVLDFNGRPPEFIADEFITYFRSTKKALQCSYKLRRKLNKYLQKYNLGIGIGIHKGKVLLGLLGGSISKRYTILGHAANVTERLQSIANPGEIIVSKSVIKYLFPNEYQKITCSLKGIGEVDAYKLILK